MTTSTGQQALIDDALNYSRVSHSGCLVSNTAADELKQCDSSALPEIEDTIRSRVVPGSVGVADHNDLLHRHPGLLSLWVAYFQIGKDAHIARIDQFLRSLDGAVLATAILGLWSVWANKGSGVTLPGPLLELLREVGADRTGSVGEVARHQLQSVWERMT
jgi:hypothetical protein